MSKYATLTDLVDASREFDKIKVDITVPARSIQYAGGKMSVPNFIGGEVVGYEQVDFEAAALQQAAGRLGIPHAYLLSCPPDLRDRNMQYWQSQIGSGRWSRKSENWLIRAVSGNGGELTARAILTGEYNAYSNTDMLTVARDYIGNDDVQLIRPWVGRDEIYAKIQALNVGDNFAAGVVLKHGETGQYQISILPFIQRHSCENSVVWTAGGWTHKHRWESQAYLAATIMEKIGHALKMTGVLHDMMIAAATQKIPQFSDVVSQICKANGFSESVKASVFMGSEGHQTKQGIVNGLSYAAHRSDLDVAEAIKLEALAGEYLMRTDRK